MNFVIIGADKRYEYLAGMLRKDGRRVFFSEGAEDLHRFSDEKCAFLLPFSASAQEQKNLLEKAKAGSAIFGGALSEENARLVRAKGLRYRDLASEEAFAAKNALPTAEGCLERLIALTPFVLNGASVLVVGFGRVGSQTARLLRRCGAFVTVCGREGKSLREAEKANFPVFVWEDLPASCPWRVIVNTVPKKKAVSADLIRRSEQLFLVLDLASGKGNVDTGALSQRNVIFESAGGLPGRYAPETAALYLYQSIHSV